MVFGGLSPDRIMKLFLEYLPLFQNQDCLLSLTLALLEKDLWFSLIYYCAEGKVPDT